MSSNLIKNNIKLFVGAFVLTIIATAGFNYNGDKTITFKNKKFIHTSKVSLPISVRLTNPDEDSLEPGTPFTLTGEVSSYRELKSLVFSWDLPEGVTVVTGPISGSLFNIKPHQPQQVSITVNISDYGNRQIHLKVKSLDRIMRFSKTAQYNTLFTEDNIDRDVAESEYTVSE